jgi:hypothetical protein
MDKVKKEWRRLYNEGLYDLYLSPNIIWVITSRRSRWIVPVAYRGDERGAIRFWCANLRDKDYVKTYTYMDDIKMVLKKWKRGHGLD